ncbi:MAG TPA: hypothetical protein VFN44_23135 [Solirubrobacteraceae bacterium]|nr:hypothetical protein [Solirubrobacteraceae bacterium]
MRLGVAVVVLAFLAFAPNASAVWGGQEDTAHPGVGAMYFDDDGDGVVTAETLVCSGSYAGRSKDGLNDVFLLAGHCLPPAEEGIPASALRVSFDRDARNGVTGTIPVVSYHQKPGFGHDLGDFNDLGILLLPLGSVGSLPAVQLPPAGYLDQLKAAGTLKFLTADLVGYGAVPVWDEPGPTFFTFDGVRRSGTSTVIGLTQNFLRFQQNRNNSISTGSGLCFGDSGSPQLEHGTLRLLSVTTGGNGQCNANNVDYRVDTAGSRAFLGQFLRLP